MATPVTTAAIVIMPRLKIAITDVAMLATSTIQNVRPAN